MASRLVALPAVLCLAAVLAPAPVAAQEASVTVSVASAPLRAEPTSSAAAIGSVKRGDRLDILVTEGDWIRVAQPGSGFAAWLHRSATQAQAAPSDAPATAAPAAAETEAAPAAVQPAYSPLPIPAEPERQPRRRKKNNTPGVAIGGGYGYQHAGFGASLYVYLQGSGPIKAALYGGAGYFPNFLASSQSALSMEGVVGYAGGGMLMVGGSQLRLVLDASYGLAGHEAGLQTQTVRVGNYYKTYTSSYDIVLYGITGAAGFEFMSEDGLTIRPMLGVTKFDEPSRMDGSEYTVTLDFTMGFRF